MINKGIILAAGLGSRLKDRTKHRPKAMIEVKGQPLIDYAISFLTPSVDEIIVVGGYEFAQLSEHIGAMGRSDITLVENPDFREGSILTVEKALPHLDGSFLLMNVDHIYPSHFIHTISSGLSGITGICDFDRELISDDMKVKLNSDRRITDIDKQLTDYDGGYIGMTSCDSASVPAYRAMVEKIIGERGGSVNVEYVLRRFAREGSYPNSLDLSGSIWLEVDDQGDLEKAIATLNANPTLKKP